MSIKQPKMNLKLNIWKLSTLLLSLGALCLSVYKWFYYSIHDIAYGTSYAPGFFYWTLVCMVIHIATLVISAISKKDVKQKKEVVKNE